jgi:predicted DNA-binding protein (UPF0251 family)
MTLMRKEGRDSVCLTIPAHVNELACLEGGHAVVVRCEGPGKIIIERVEANRVIRKGRSLTPEEVAALRSCFNRGLDHTDAALEVGVSRVTAWRWFVDFEERVR